MKQYFTDVTSPCNRLWLDYLLKWNRIWAIMSTSKLESKLHDLAMRKKNIQRRKIPFLRYSLPLKRNKHMWLAGNKGLIDIHNMSKYHFLRMSWSKEIMFLISSIMQKLPDFLSYWIPHPLQILSHFTRKATDSALISWTFIKFNKGRLKKIHDSTGPSNWYKKTFLGGSWPMDYSVCIIYGLFKIQ